MVDSDLVLEVLGVIDGRAPGGVGNGSGMDLVVDLAGWKFPGKALKKEELRIRMPIPPEHEIQDYFDLFRPYFLVRVNGRLKLGESGKYEELLAEEMAVAKLDEECQSFSLELQKPLFVQDPFFGELIFDRSLNWFTGEISWGGSLVPITFSIEGPLDHGLEQSRLEPLVAIGRKLLEDKTRWGTAIKSCIYGEIFPYFNEMLVQLSESPLSLEEFKNLHSHESIIIHNPDLVRLSFEFKNPWLYGFDIGFSLSEGIYDWKIHM